MQVTSLVFLAFFTAVFTIYWLPVFRSNRMQNIFLLAASYFFYGWWDYRFLFLLVAVSLMNYSIALIMNSRHGRRDKRLWMISGVVINSAVLFYFKYYNFFLVSFVAMFNKLTGITLEASSVSVVLPLGISFFTFLSVSYLVDAYFDRLPVSRDLPAVLLTFSFFPIIIAGPIQRPVWLLPQILSRRSFDTSLAVDGLRRILLGLFMKMVVADQFTEYINQIFTTPQQFTAGALALGALLYSVQIYADFAGYSEIAIGIAALLGFRLVRNFAFPYFAKDIADFWKRWHISLTTWFRDYIFLPFAYAVSKRLPKERYLLIKSDIMIYLAGLVVTWLLTGLWHGANTTFILWGLWHGFFLFLHHLLKNPRKNLLKRFPQGIIKLFVGLLERIVVLMVVVVGWTVFRSADMEHATAYISRIFKGPLFTNPALDHPERLIIVVLFFLAEWVQRDRIHVLEFGPGRVPVWVRWSVYYLTMAAIFLFSANGQVFIYSMF